MNFNDFSSTSEHQTALAWNFFDSTYIFGDGEGQVLTLPVLHNQTFRTTKINEMLINSITVHPVDRFVIIALDNHIYSTPISDDKNQILGDSSDLKEIINVNAQVNAIVLDSSGNNMFIAGMQTDIWLLKYSKNSPVLFQLSHKINTNQTDILSMQLNSNHFLASLSGSGTVSVFKLHNIHNDLTVSYGPSYNIDEELQGIVSISANNSTMHHRLVWYPVLESDATIPNVLAIPGGQGAIIILIQKEKGTNWIQRTLVSPSMASDPIASLSHEDDDLHLVDFSTCGKYLVSMDVTSLALIWAFNPTNPPNSEPIRKINFSMYSTSPFFTVKDLQWSRNKASPHSIMVLEANSWGIFKNVIEYDKNASNALQVEKPLMEETSNESVLPLNPAPEPTGPVSIPPSGNTAAPRKHKRLTKVNENNTMNDADDDMLLEENDTVSPPLPPSSSKVDSVQFDSTNIRKLKNAVEKATTGNESGTGNKNSIADDEAHESKLLDEDDDEEEDEGEDDGMNTKDAKMDIEKIIELANSIQSSNKGSSQYRVQTPFQPACTKWDEKQRRYLVWNSVGNITQRVEDADLQENRIEIRFTNTMGSNKQEAFSDRSGFTMAALSYEGAVFATDAELETEDERGLGHEKGLNHLLRETERLESNQNDRKEGSIIYYHAFPGQKQLEGVNESFRYTLTGGEAALCVAVGRGWIAVATSKQFLRVYSSTGLELMVLWLKGPIVTMCGYDSLLIVVYHSGGSCVNHDSKSSGRQETAPMKADVYEFNAKDGNRGNCVVSDLSVPLSRYATLDWIGFDVDMMIPVVIDSKGMVSFLLQVMGWTWVPVLNIHEVRKSLDHIYWPIMVKSQKLVYVLLNGENKPSIYPQPVVSVKPLRIPTASARDGKKVTDIQLESKHGLMWNQQLRIHLENKKWSRNEVLSELMLGESRGKSEALMKLLESNGYQGTCNPTSLVALDLLDQEEYKLQLQHVQSDTVILKLFQDACQQQRLPEALNIILLLRTKKALKVAVTIADRYGRSNVATALDKLLQLRESEEMKSINPAPMGRDEDDNQELYHREEVGFGDDMRGGNDGRRGIDASLEVSNSISSKLNANKNTLMSSHPLKRSMEMKESSFNPSKKHIVSPANTTSVGDELGVKPEEEDVSENNHQNIPVNPFAVQSVTNTPSKRKDLLHSGVLELKGSPSPKKPALSRLSSFSQQARLQRMNDKRIL